MTTTIRRSVAAAVLTATMLLPATAALALSFNTTLSYTTTLTGANRDFFNATSITVVGTYSESANTDINTHRLELWRNRFGPDDLVGSTNVTRSGFASRTWTNTGPGTYRVYYSKANDGVRITSNDLKIKDQNG